MYNTREVGAETLRTYRYWIDEKHVAQFIAEVARVDGYAKVRTVAEGYAMVQIIGTTRTFIAVDAKLAPKHGATIAK